MDFYTSNVFLNPIPPGLDPQHILRTQPLNVDSLQLN